MTQADLRDDTSEKAPRQRPISVDLSGYPDLTVVYLGFHVSTLRGLAAFLGIGRKLTAMRNEKPDGLLVHETIVFGLRHVGMRQYWRDFDSLEAFTRSDPHKTWWATFSKDQAGSGFWHEAYRRSGGIEGVYIGMPAPLGLAAFAPPRAPTGPFARSRQRLAA
jgi:hypothetical protein